MILRNLVENSVRHARRRARAGASDRARRAAIRCCSNTTTTAPARRCPARELGRMFGRGASSGGTGIGLYLVRALMQRMGGRRRVSTARRAQGFAPSLSLRRAARKPALEQPARSCWWSRTRRNVGETLAERLRDAGFRVTLAGQRGARAPGLAGAATAAVRAGCRACRMATASIWLANCARAVPQAAIIFLTAHGNPEERVRGLELGADDYVSKPFHFRELLLRIQNCLKRAQDLVELPRRDARRGAHRPRARRLRALQRGSGRRPATPSRTRNARCCGCWPAASARP